MSERRAPLRLFEAFGIEIEYMIVDAETLDVLPACDKVLERAAGSVVSDVERGVLDWSNELVLHVIELKTAGPAASLDGLASTFQEEARAIERLLDGLGGRLMPGAMHPWMDPFRETRLWPYDNSPVYAAFDRIFGCQGHGWSNLQSLHINLPFGDDAEFARLHAAIRLVLPLLPGLAASSPVADGRLTGALDTRLRVYRDNARRIPAVTGKVIPELVGSPADYQTTILEPMYRAIAPHDPEGVLQHEWLNARGAIARFDRGAIEIRLIDVQECPAADLAIATLVIAAVRALAEERWSDLQGLSRFGVDALAGLLEEGTRVAERAVVGDRAYLAAFGYPRSTATAGELWRHLAEALLPAAGTPVATTAPLELIAREGTLARRLTAALGPDPSRDRLVAVYRRLCDCLRQGSLFRGAG